MAGRGLTTALVFTAAVAAAGADSEFRMKPVRTIHARVQGDTPVWDATHDAFVSSFGATFEDRYRATMDTVNTASVEGALMYVQAEGINQNEQSVKCERKNKMQNVVFYEITVAQTAPSVAQYGAVASQALPEYCPFAALDGGECTPEGPGDKLPVVCEQILGQNGQPNIGPCVGGETRETDPRAPYPDTIWFSFPNGCLTKGWSDKTAACRAQQHGGLCAFGSQPDGVTCTFASTILGYVSIDDVVGITSITKSDGTNATYRNFTEFCEAGGVEFKATNNVVEKALPFWQNPLNASANAKRAQKLVAAYNAKRSETMQPLPTIAELAAANPPCYENSPVCAAAPLGCRRTLYSQICEVCETRASDCVAAPAGFKFPKLTKGSTGDGSSSGSGGGGSEAGVTPAPSRTTTTRTRSPAATSAPTNRTSAPSSDEGDNSDSEGETTVTPAPSRTTTTRTRSPAATSAPTNRTSAPSSDEGDTNENDGNDGNDGNGTNDHGESSDGDREAWAQPTPSGPPASIDFSLLSGNATGTAAPTTKPKNRTTTNATISVERSSVSAADRPLASAVGSTAVAAAVAALVLTVAA